MSYHYLNIFFKDEILECRGVTAKLLDMFRMPPQRDDLRNFLMSGECLRLGKLVANMSWCGGLQASDMTDKLLKYVIICSKLRSMLINAAVCAVM